VQSVDEDVRGQDFFQIRAEISEMRFP